ncbi:MAG: amidophosphoribosyltransferase, partial [Muribaculaceae bacterium]|nr:amidophosphoribosyltransferase [Muribaculaceae bacterium]
LFYGVDYNSHMGTKRAGIGTVNSDGIFTRSIHNIENSYFRTKFEPDLADFTGNSGIGVISDTDAQPIIVNSRLGKFAIVTVARINNIDELEHRLLEQGQHFCEHSYDIVNPTELLATLITQGNDLVEGINNVYRLVKGSCSMLLLMENGDIIAARDKLGRTPIILGRNTNGLGWAATSETCAFPNLDFAIAYNIGPGEIVRFNADGYTVLQQPLDKMQICAFLWTYYGYPPCEYEGRNVDEMRMSLGNDMGERDKTELDFVSPVPDSGIGMALGYSQGKRVPYKRGIVKYTPTWPRSFTPSSQERRELVAKMKLIADPALLKGKRVAFCDDSIVRGTQLRDNVADIRNAGATEVHVRISCPPLIYPCEFLNFTSSKSPME